jgi:Ser/Thr protein kinase RdoA (MazF antagonist)
VDELAHDLAREWLGEVVLRPLDAMNSSAWEVRAGRERYVLKVAALGDEPGLQAAACLERQGMRAGAPLEIAVRDGRLAALLRFVEGRPLGKDDVVIFGAALGRVHRRLAGCPVPSGMERWPWRWLETDIIEEPDLRAAAIAAVDRANDLAGSLTHGILHGDPMPEAFIDAEGDIGLIDWGSACHGPLLYDVASAQMYTDPRVVDAYSRTGPVDREELAHVPDLFAFRMAVQAWYFSWRTARGDMTGIEGPAGNEEGLAHARTELLGTGRRVP